ncbi:MAG: hypothetical protein R6W72_11380 [Desulfurivibrionaceae bacterium]
MTLANLLETGRLREHEPTADEIRDLLNAARRNLADAEVTAISQETRFDAAYKAVMQLSLVALMANGYRPGSGGGHHMTMIQSLPKAIGLSKDRMIVLDALRRKRNAADYLGGYVDEAATASGITEAKQLQDDVLAWLAENRSDLV